MSTNFNNTFHKAIFLKVSKEIFYILSKSSRDVQIEFSKFEESNILENTVILQTSDNLAKKTHRNLLRYHTDFFSFYKRYHNQDIFMEVSRNATSEWQVNFLESAEKARIIALAHEEHKNMLGIKNNLKGYAKTLNDDIVYYFLNLLDFKLPSSLFQDRNKINYDYDFKDLAKYICSQRDFLAFVLSVIHIKGRDLHDNHMNDINNSDNLANHTPNDSNLHMDSDSSEKNQDNDSNNMDNQGNNPQSNHMQEKITTRGMNANAFQDHYDDENNNYYNPDSIYKLKKHPTYESKKYFAYTKKYDQEVMAMDLESFPGEAINLRRKLDTALSNTTNSNINMLALKLQRKLQTRKYNARNDNLSYGMLDTKKLYKAITSPLSPNVYYQETKREEMNTTVTILVDNSGSQMGQAITTSCISCDLLAKVFERCNISCEILGFTTKKWQGGLSFKDWQQHIKRNPHKLQESNNAGRLNDLLHIIYKPANKKHSLTKNHMAMMLKRGILKENIDGEALEWAYERLLTRSEQRKIILVISDGTPADDITQTYNDKNYLLKHLKSVIGRINKDNSVELLAIGMGFDIQSIYKNSIHIKDHTNLGQTIMNLFLHKL